MTDNLSPATLAVEEPICVECLTHDGLCAFHEKHILPQLAQPFWYRLVGQRLVEEAPLPDESTAVLKAKRRVAKRLQRAMAGGFTPVRGARC